MDRTNLTACCPLSPRRPSYFAVLCISILNSIALATVFGAFVFKAPQAMACGVPVCDIASEIVKMEGKNEAYRFQLINKMRQEFSKEQDEAKLNNLREFARQAEELIRRVGDADYVLREVKSLRDQSIFLLVQWVWRDCRRLSEGYGELAGEAQRYAALDFFKRRVDGLRDEPQIRELVCFAAYAEEKSMNLGDPDYVARQALALGAALSNQLLEVIDGWEGTFRLSSIEGPLAEDLEDLRFVIFSTGGELGIVAALTHPTLNPSVFQRLSFEENPQKMASRQSLGSQSPSTLSLRFSEDFGTLEGQLLDANEFKPLNFKAVRAVSVRAATESPCSEDEILGKHRASYGGFLGYFIIARIGPKQFAAIFRSDGSELHLPFAFGRYNENTGRLTFINLQKNVPLGVRLLAETDELKKCKMRGWGLSSFSGATYPIFLDEAERTSESKK
jgi:hypothetical protein